MMQFINPASKYFTIVIVRIDRTINGPILLGGFAGANKLIMTCFTLSLSKGGFPDQVGE